jgi:adenosine deaminase
VRDLTALPKAHLHVHLDGAMRRATLDDLAEQAGVTIPPMGDHAHFYARFSTFMYAIGAAQSAIDSSADLCRVVTEVVEDAAADGVVWLELSLWPGFLGTRLGPPEHVLELVLDAGKTAAGRLDVGFGVMVAANRDRGPLQALDVARLASRFAAAGVVSFGLDGDELAHDTELFAPACALAREAGLLCTPHAGELAGPASVEVALETLGADRILHGIRSVEDPELLARLALANVCLDVCPSSNVALSVVASIAEHPLPRLLDAGVTCSLNADDPLLFGRSILDEYRLCREQMALSDQDLGQLASSSLRHSAAPEDLRRRSLDQIARWLASPAGPERPVGPGCSV